MIYLVGHRPNTTCTHQCNSETFYFTGEWKHVCGSDGNWTGSNLPFSCHQRNFEESLLVIGGWESWHKMELDRQVFIRLISNLFDFRAPTWALARFYFWCGQVDRSRSWQHQYPRFARLLLGNKEFQCLRLLKDQTNLIFFKTYKALSQICSLFWFFKVSS